MVGSIFVAYSIVSFLNILRGNCETVSHIIRGHTSYKTYLRMALKAKDVHEESEGSLHNI